MIEGCSSPVIIAGGQKQNNLRGVFKMVRDALDCGAIGVAMGRNIWQYKEPVKLVSGLRLLIHENLPIEKIFKEVGLE